MCEQCRETNDALEAASSANELLAVVQGLIDRGVAVPPGLVSMVNRMAVYENVLKANPDASVEEKQKLLVDAVMNMDGGRLDQEFSAFREIGYELVDTAGMLSVTEIDSVKCWVQVGMAVMNRTSPAMAIGVLCALLVELGRQPELVAQIRTKNAQVLGD